MRTAVTAQPGPPAPPPPPAPSDPTWLRVLSTALKLAVIGLIGVAAWWLIQAYRDVMPVRTPPPKPGPPPEATDAPPDWLLSPGGWSIGDMPWQVTRAAVSAGELPQRISSEGPPLVSTRAADSVETDIITWLKRSTTAKRKGVLTEYALTVNHTRFRGVVEETPGAERLRFGQVAWPDGNGWQLLELVPTPGEVGRADPLLPVPAGAALVARRWTDGGRAVAELVGPLTPDADPAAEWQKAGWSLAAPPGGGVPGERYARGDAVREVWRLPGPPGGAGQDFLLVFVPPNR